MTKTKESDAILRQCRIGVLRRDIFEARRELASINRPIVCGKCANFARIPGANGERGRCGASLPAWAANVFGSIRSEESGRCVMASDSADGCSAWL